MIGRRLKSGSPYLNLTERANIVVTDTGKEIYRTENFGEPAPHRTRGHAGAVMRMRVLVTRALARGVALAGAAGAAIGPGV